MISIFGVLFVANSSAVSEIMKLLPLLLCFAASAYAGTYDTREATEEIFRSLGKQTAERVAKR